jgi:hypothetical protein
MAAAMATLLDLLDNDIAVASHSRALIAHAGRGLF